MSASTSTESKSVEFSDVSKPNESAVAASDPDASRDAAAAPAPELQVEYFKIFRYADTRDWALLVFGTFLACANGVTMPAFSLIFGDLLNSFNVPSDMLSVVSRYALNLVWIGLGTFFASWGSIAIFIGVGERQARRIREEYLKSILKQDMSWFDQHKAGELSTRLVADTELIQEGITQKAQAYIQFMSTFLAGVILGFVKGWQLTLVILAVTPLLAAAGAVMSIMLARKGQSGSDAYAKAGEVADEVLTSIRTVVAMNGQERERARYKSLLVEAYEAGIQGSIISAASMGSVMAIMFFAYGLALWYGAKLIGDGTINPSSGVAYTGGDIVAVFFSVLMGSFAIGQAAPSVPAFASAKGAAFRIFEVIDRTPMIDASSSEGQSLSNLQGDIVFEDVHFSYPSRPDAKVLNGLNLRIPAGKTVALVGHSGCGKSTLITLLERWYDPSSGRIVVDNQCEIKAMNLKWWRQSLGLVQQEPTLFGVSLRDNIAVGVDHVATDAEIEQAAKAANAFDFIKALPQSFDTMIGESGSEQLSGGQKQRVAIARAIIKNPRILLLDESTSALDNESERVVQEALDKLMPGRTTLVIAHRLSTIRNADVIVVLDHGQVAEQGTHDELVAKDGLYSKLLRAQAMQEAAAPVSVASEVVAKKSDQVAIQVSAESSNGPAGPASPKNAVASPSTSVKSVEEQKAELQQKIDALPEVPVSRVMGLTSEEWPWFIVGLIGAAGNGSIFPLFSQIFSEMLSAFYIPVVSEMQHKAALMAYAFIGLGIGMFAVSFMQRYAFSRIGESLTLKLRDQAFGAMMRQEIGFFDVEEHQPRMMGAKLASEAPQVRVTGGENIGIALQTATMMIAGVVLAMIYGWQLALLVLGIGPLIALAGALQFKVLAGFQAEAKQALEKSCQIATESLAGIRTLSAFCAEQRVYGRFQEQMDVTIKLADTRSHVAGLGFGFAQLILFWAYALCFWFGGWLINKGIMDFPSVLKTFFAVIMSAMGAGQVSAMVPDAQKAQYATRSIFQLLDRTPSIDCESESGSKIELAGSDVEFKSVAFAYPTRPDVPVFRSVSFTVKAGQKVALVGPSGSGKSTAISMLLRYYNPDQGKISVGGRDITELNIKVLRSSIGLVSQEPVLFATSIMDNIRYGNPSATDEQVRDAARRANALSFIEEFPNGFQTIVGPRGSQLSGGQKQRVAIARALLRDPKLLLLDEATSALDNESERIVQEALDKLMHGRTTIVVAHRLSTIRSADLIVVLDRGNVVEQGTYDELMQRNGLFAALASAHAEKAAH